MAIQTTFRGCGHHHVLRTPSPRAGPRAITNRFLSKLKRWTPSLSKGKTNEEKTEEQGLCDACASVLSVPDTAGSGSGSSVRHAAPFAQGMEETLNLIQLRGDSTALSSLRRVQRVARRESRLPTQATAGPVHVQTQEHFNNIAVQQASQAEYEASKEYYKSIHTASHHTAEKAGPLSCGDCAATQRALRDGRFRSGVRNVFRSTSNSHYRPIQAPVPRRDLRAGVLDVADGNLVVATERESIDASDGEPVDLENQDRVQSWLLSQARGVGEEQPPTDPNPSLHPESSNDSNEDENPHDRAASSSHSSVSTDAAGVPLPPSTLSSSSSSPSSSSSSSSSANRSEVVNPASIQLPLGLSNEAEMLDTYSDGSSNAVRASDLASWISDEDFDEAQFVQPFTDDALAYLPTTTYAAEESRALTPGAVDQAAFLGSDTGSDSSSDEGSMPYDDYERQEYLYSLYSESWDSYLDRHPHFSSFPSGTTQHIPGPPHYYPYTLIPDSDKGKRLLARIRQYYCIAPEMEDCDIWDHLHDPRLQEYMFSTHVYHPRPDRREEQKRMRRDNYSILATWPLQVSGTLSQQRAHAWSMVKSINWSWYDRENDSNFVSEGGYEGIHADNIEEVSSPTSPFTDQPEPSQPSDLTTLSSPSFFTDLDASEVADERWDENFVEIIFDDANTRIPAAVVSATASSRRERNTELRVRYTDKGTRGLRLEHAPRVVSSLRKELLRSGDEW